jgi:hypothetical protein
MEYYLHPIKVKEYYINDIFYNEDNQHVYIIFRGHTPKLRVESYDNVENRRMTFQSKICPHNHTYIYYLLISKNVSNTNIDLIIENNIVNVKVNKYPTFKDEIILSTLVKNEDAFIKPWIDFHHRLGITRFIIYDNSDKNTLGDLLKDHILKGIVVLIKWAYDYQGERAQQTQQNHSIYVFQSSKYIGLLDIDEYVNIQQKKKINEFFDEFIKENNINIEQISCFQLLNKNFYNPYNLSVDSSRFLYIFNCDNIIKNSNQKCFVIPKNVNTFSVHVVTDGLPMYTISETFIYFNHYIFLNKPFRGRNKTILTDNSILRHL